MRIGFFFGAGAEVGYGLPSGGKFAIDLFRQDTTPHKQNLRRQLHQIDSYSPYATDWLPERYANQRIHAFGKNEFTSLIESSIEYRRDEIIRRFNLLDDEAERAMQQLGINRQILAEKFQREMEYDYGARLYTQAVRINPILAENARLFGSEYYSALLDIVKNTPENVDIKRYAGAFLQLLIGAHGQQLVQRLNHELFEAAPDEIPIFDDICGMFRLEFDRAGLTAMELLLEQPPQAQINAESSLQETLLAINSQILENIFSTVLDYQSLIDNHFRYLFSPKTEWAKFTKMVVFLWATRTYIVNQLEHATDIPQQGYYHDLTEAAQFGVEINAVGTANYNNIIESVTEQLGIHIPQPQHLNGSVNDYYNPYRNSVATYNSPDLLPTDQVHVPFILTQSGLKPLTSVDMSRRYVNLFDSFCQSDAIVAIGYAFNIDDSHINGLFRELVEDCGRDIFWLYLETEGQEDAQKRKLARRLRISPQNFNKVHVLPVSARERQVNGRSWFEELMGRIDQIAR